MLSDITTTTTI